MPENALAVTTRSLESGGLVFSRRIYPPNSVLPQHTHAEAYVSFAGAGSYSERVGRTLRDCADSTLLYHPAGETHENAFHGKPVELLRIEASESNLLNLASRSRIPEGAGPYACRKMLRELQAPDDLTPMVLLGLAYELIAELARQKDGAANGPHWLRRVDDMLQESFLAPWSLEDLAKQSGVHPVHLCKVYRRFRGKTIGDQIRELRLQRACLQLSTTELAIGEVASNCGFCDQSHLSREMQRRLGISPTQYRASTNRG